MLFGTLQKRFIYRQFALFAWLLFILLLALISKAERLPIKTYTVADGLLRDNVFKIKKDSRGFLWFCTVEGISRFDGVGMTNFTVADGLPDRHVNDFLETRSSTIYLATDGGLAKLNPPGIRAPFESEKSIQNPNNPLFTVILPDHPLAKSIRVLFEDDGKFWVATTKGLCEWQDGFSSVCKNYTKENDLCDEE